MVQLLIHSFHRMLHNQKSLKKILNTHNVPIIINNYSLHISTLNDNITSSQKN